MWKKIAEGVYAAATGPLLFTVRRGTKAWEAEIQIRSAIPEMMLWKEGRFPDADTAKLTAVTAAKELLAATIEDVESLIPQR